MKLLKKDIDAAIARTPCSMDDVCIRSMNSVLLGYYTPKDANWSYELHAISVAGQPMVVASRFGYIMAEGK